MEVVTVRKLEFETDSFAFGDKILARWYPDKSEADKKGILIVVTTAKDGAIIGGPSFMQVCNSNHTLADHKHLARGCDNRLHFVLTGHTITYYCCTPQVNVCHADCLTSSPFQQRATPK